MKALAQIAAVAFCSFCACAAAEPASAGLFSDGSLFGSNDSNKNNDTSNGAPVQSLPTDIDGGIRQAQLLRAQGSYQQAGQMLSQLMMAAPDNARIVGEYGKVMVQEGRSADALAFLQRAAQLQPDDWTLFSATGVAYDQAGDFANAKLAYDHALMLKPGNAVILNNYALSRVQAGDLAGASQMIAQAKANGSDPKIDANVALVASLSGGRVQPAAAAAYNAPVAPTATANAATNLPRQVAQGIARGQVVMQKVPVDPKAGPVRVARPAPSRVARAPKKSAAQVAATTPSLRSGADGLRADASSP